MIIVNLKGGTGNQMFQYAFGKKLALKNNDTLKLEIAGLAKANDMGDIYRPFSLGAFQIEKNIANTDEVQKVKYPYGIISKALRFVNFRILKNTHKNFNAKLLNKTGDIFLDGYWQSPLYFNDIRDILLKEFSLQTPLSAPVVKYEEQIKNSTSVSIHVRRADYVKNPRVLKEFGICEQSYYKKAIAHITEKIDAPTFFIFSDDLQWVMENLSLPESAVFIQDPNLQDVEELALMSTCTHNIIANSTFSWWGAWLNTHDDKIVICPTPWFDNNSFDQNLIPKTWIQIQKA